jgi:MFS family permease
MAGRLPMRRHAATVGGSLVGLAIGWNITNVGAIAEPLSRAYGVGLAVVGLFTASLFLVHALVQIPGGRLADRQGAWSVALGSLLVVAVGNGLLLVAADPVFAAVVRACIGLGTGAGFVAGSDYVRSAGGGQVSQGLYGGSTMAGGGLALAVVPSLHDSLDWRAPFASAAVVALLALVALASSPRPAAARLHRADAGVATLLADRRLYRLSVAHMASLGLNALVANWTVTLLTRAGGFSLGAAGLASALTLTAGIVGRPLGGLLARRHPDRRRELVAASLVTGAAGTALLVPARPLPLVLCAATLVGLGAGLAFAPVFAAAASLRPDSPGGAVGVVNMAGNLVIVVGTPLLGLAFALPGDGRIGFAATAAVWAAALIALPRSSELGKRVSETARSGTALNR